jgi:hypothetical protein
MQKNVKNFTPPQEPRVNVEKQDFYQKDVLIDYFFKILEIKHIFGVLCGVDASRAA